MGAFRTRIKVCGLTRPRDAALAVAAGADALGVVFADSPRCISIDRAREVFSAVPLFVTRVGVFVDSGPEFVARAVTELGLHAVQFSGGEDPWRCLSAPVPAIKALRVAGIVERSAMEIYRGKAAAILLDTHVPGKAGGTGVPFDWHAVAPLPDWAPTIVAGGLNAGNVGAAIAALNPYAVDVSSGVEFEPGIKDAVRLVEFCSAVREADREVYRS
ncbi:MAG: phosphoribosylanthranilate isomerase [Actinobacteria bacterium]|nr:MAG: phosphoribosylanthranilate isomerase [Actinomycetota bacterium]